MELCLDSKGKKQLQYLQYFMHRINLLRHYKITPVVVFDGGNIPCKAATEQERHRHVTGFSHSADCFSECPSRIFFLFLFFGDYICFLMSVILVGSVKEGIITIWQCQSSMQVMSQVLVSSSRYHLSFFAPS